MLPLIRFILSDTNYVSRETGNVQPGVMTWLILFARWVLHRTFCSLQARRNKQIGSTKSNTQHNYVTALTVIQQYARPIKQWLKITAVCCHLKHLLYVSRETELRFVITARLPIIVMSVLICGAAHSHEIAISNLQLLPDKNGYHLSSNFDFELSPYLENALIKGVALNFKTSFEIKKAVWYWRDKSIVSKERNFKLNYHPLTRKYRLRSGSLHLAYDNLQQALNMLKRLRSWPVVDHHLLKKKEKYKVGLRIFLDKSQLPPPFQITEFNNTNLDLDSGWIRWSFSTSGEHYE